MVVGKWLKGIKPFVLKDERFYRTFKAYLNLFKSSLKRSLNELNWSQMDMTFNETE